MDGLVMNPETTQAVDRLRRIRGRATGEAPIALVDGPDIHLSTGDPDQPFWIASVDKVFIATLIAQLFDDGSVTPETPIGQLLPTSTTTHLPAVPGVDNQRDITVARLLAHTSGLYDICEPPRGVFTTCSIEQIHRHPDRLWTVESLLEQSAELPPFAAPGTRFQYSDTGYLLLIRILEEARGSGFGAELKKRILDPCGMDDTAAWVDADGQDLRLLVDRLAPFQLGSGIRDNRAAFAPNLTWSRGMGGPSTANDLVRFQRHLHAGRLCGRQWLTTMGEPQHRRHRGIYSGAGMTALRFGGFFPTLRHYPDAVGGLGYTAVHAFYYPDHHTHVILNFHEHRQMTTSFRHHIRIAALIKNSAINQREAS